MLLDGRREVLPGNIAAALRIVFYQRLRLDYRLAHSSQGLSQLFYLFLSHKDILHMSARIREIEVVGFFGSYVIRRLRHYA